MDCRTQRIISGTSNAFAGARMACNLHRWRTCDADSAFALLPLASHICAVRRMMLAEIARWNWCNKVFGAVVAKPFARQSAINHAQLVLPLSACVHCYVDFFVFSVLPCGRIWRIKTLLTSKCADEATAAALRQNCSLCWVLRRSLKSNRLFLDLKGYPRYQAPRRSC